MVTFLVDSSVALRILSESDIRFTEATENIDQALGKGHRFTIVAQVVAECWSVITRPLEANGFGLSPSDAALLVQRLFAMFEVKDDPANLAKLLASFAASHQVSGRQIHDARLALTCELLGLNGIVTYNKSDFVRYTTISAIEPAELSSLSA